MLKGKKILITGGAGFIGQYLSEYLIRKGAKVKIVDLKKRPDGINRKIDYIRGDIRNIDLAGKAAKDIDICFHLAAVYGGTRFINDNQADILNYNLQTFSSIFEALRNTKVKRIIFPSSSLAYNGNLKRALTEEDMDKDVPTGNPYGFMKLVGEYYCRFYWNQYKLPYTIVRMFNVYGIGDMHEHVIPIFVDKVLKNQPVPIMGDGTETRVFTNIKDIVRGLALLADSEKAKNQEFNLSGEKEISIINLAGLIWDLSGKRGDVKINFIPLPETAARTRRVSCKKIAKLGWKEKSSFNQGLKEFIAWKKTLKK